MKKNEVQELRKLYKSKDDISVRFISYGYVNADREILCADRKRFLSMDDDGQFKYLDIIKKGMSGTVGKNICTMDMPDSDQKRMLLSMVADDMENKELVLNFCQMLGKTYPECGNLLIILITNTYDIPFRGKDGQKNVEASEEVYSFIQGFVCPVTLENPGLFYNEGRTAFEKKDTRWCVDAPIGSFLYPSFEDRSQDNGKITIFSRKADGPLVDMLQNLFSLGKTHGYEEQCELVQQVIETAVNDRDDKIMAVRAIQQNINEKIKEKDNADLTKQDISNILSETGIESKNVQEAVDLLDDSYENISAVAAKKKDIQIKTPDICVKIKADCKAAVETRMIEGKECLLIELGDENTVEVNMV